VLVNTLTVGRINAEALRFNTTIEHIVGKAAVNGMRYQLVIDIDQNRYWAECTELDVPLPSDLMRTVDGEDRERYDDDDDQADPLGLSQEASWDDCSEPLLPPHDVREGVRIARVMTAHQYEPFEEGETTIAVFPDGFVEPAIVWFAEADGEQFMTVFVDPMTATTRIERGDAEVPDDFLEVEED
jgi:hypothetical protein